MQSNVRRILISGAMGKMGQQVLIAAMGEPTLRVIAGIDRKEGGKIWEIPLLSSWEKAPNDAELVVDFSSPDGFENALGWCISKGVPFLSGTTGLDSKQKDELIEAGKTIPVMWAPNMSLGINLTLKLAEKLSKLLPDYDIEIVERHHKRKKDSPSGTALSLVESVNRHRLVSNEKIKFGRGYGENKREYGEIGVHAVRGGGVVGEHTIYFTGMDDEIILTHRAFSRQVFARGAIRAIFWLLGREKGFYTLTDTFTTE